LKHDGYHGHKDDGLQDAQAVTPSELLLSPKVRPGAGVHVARRSLQLMHAGAAHKPQHMPPQTTA